MINDGQEEELAWREAIEHRDLPVCRWLERNIDTCYLEKGCILFASNHQSSNRLAIVARKSIEWWMRRCRVWSIAECRRLWANAGDIVKWKKEKSGRFRINWWPVDSDEEARSGPDSDSDRASDSEDEESRTHGDWWTVSVDQELALAALHAEQEGISE